MYDGRAIDTGDVFLERGRRFGFKGCFFLLVLIELFRCVRFCFGCCVGLESWRLIGVCLFLGFLMGKLFINLRFFLKEMVNVISRKRIRLVFVDVVIILSGRKRKDCNIG